MPIYEFKCAKCEEFFEIIVMNSNKEDIINCPKCKSNEFERVLSTTNYSMGASANKTSKVETKERKCSSGSCKTYTIPGVAK